jgi:predicted acylesterase/phospholipase RssA
MMAKTRVALVLSGGVSLGSYIAGALDELLRKMALNGNYEIDIITGASAGATTAAIIAHGLMYRGGETLLHRIWVEQIDIVDLLEPEIPSDTPLSLLSNRRLIEIAREGLSPPAGQAPARSPLCASRLKVAMTIANLDGLSYESRVKMRTDSTPEPYIQDRFAEQETFLLTARTPPDDPVWQRMVKVGLASAALPMVFPPIALARKLVEQGGADRPEWSGSIQYIQYPSRSPEQSAVTEATFLYADGGTFNNLPIDLAWHYAREHDRPAAPRIMIIVDPSKDHIRRIDLGPAEDRPAYRSPPVYLLRLVGAMRSESSAIQFDREVLLPAQRGNDRLDELQGALPGVDRAEVEALNNVVLVLPHPEQPRLIGSHLVYALAGFLDRKFREYDFRRGAADARQMAEKVLEIPQPVERPEGPIFYTPDQDQQFQPYPQTYATLEQIKSSRFPTQSISEVLEARLRKRLQAVIRGFPFGGPWWLRAGWWLARFPISWLLPGWAIKQLPDHWGASSAKKTS